MAELKDALEVARSTVYWNKNKKTKPVQAELVEEAIAKKEKVGRCTYESSIATEGVSIQQKASEITETN